MLNYVTSQLYLITYSIVPKLIIFGKIQMPFAITLSNRYKTIKGNHSATTSISLWVQLDEKLHTVKPYTRLHMATFKPWCLLASIHTRILTLVTRRLNLIILPSSVYIVVRTHNKYTLHSNVILFIHIILPYPKKSYKIGPPIYLRWWY